ncbi:MAG: transposase, partial [Candidatus Competibacterales bacterium]
SDRLDALTLADHYRDRWQLETAFKSLTVELRCEVESLAQPLAALFAFAVACLAYNLLSLMMTVMQQAHPTVDIQEDLSRYQLAGEIASTYRVIAELPDDLWIPSLQQTEPAFNAGLIALAEQDPLHRFHKAQRATPPRPPPKRQHNPKQPHVSVARQLAARKSQTQ